MCVRVCVCVCVSVSVCVHVLVHVLLFISCIYGAAQAWCVYICRFVFAFMLISMCRCIYRETSISVFVCVIG